MIILILTVAVIRAKQLSLHCTETHFMQERFLKLQFILLLTVVNA